MFVWSTGVISWTAFGFFAIHIYIYKYNIYTYMAVHYMFVFLISTPQWNCTFENSHWNTKLVGGFNPSEKHARQNEFIFPK